MEGSAEGNGKDRLAVDRDLIEGGDDAGVNQSRQIVCQLVDQAGIVWGDQLVAIAHIKERCLFQEILRVVHKR